MKNTFTKWIYSFVVLYVISRCMISASMTSAIELTILPDSENSLIESTSDLISYGGHYYSAFDELKTLIILSIISLESFSLIFSLE